MRPCVNEQPAFSHLFKEWHDTETRVDHLNFAADPDELIATAERRSDALVVEPTNKLHLHFVTRNSIISL